MAKAGFLGFLTDIVLFLLLLAGTMAGQPRTGNIYGRITDEEGILLPDVHITLRAPQTTSVSTVTGPTGRYRLISLSPGTEYEISAELTGFKKTTQAGVVVQADVNVEINLTLEKPIPIVPKWSAARAAFDRLVKDPSPLTAREFYLSISDEKYPKGDKTAILDHVFGPYIREFMPDVGRFSVIAIEMLDGDIHAARSAIRILGFVEKEWQKPPSLKLPICLSIGASLGVLMRANPTLYLRACYEERESSFLKEKSLPYGYVPFILHMKKTMVSYDMEMRKEALRSVEDPELRFVRDECLYLIENGTQFMEANAVERPILEAPEGNGSGVAQETVKNVLLEMMGRPSPENMRKVLALFDERRREFPYVTAAVFPLISRPDQVWPPYRPCPDPLSIILHEAICGNKYAIEIVFTALLPAFRAWDDLASQSLVGFISDLMLMKPAVFIENVAKFGYLESERLDTVPITFLDWICGTVDFHSYPDEKAKETILRRRIAALEALKMPEHKELIDRCIRLIAKKLD
ncbi:MAG: carboxypeptidase-like regulatory domain-containing protein [Candidatus Aminicenantales bacterium]